MEFLKEQYAQDAAFLRGPFRPLLRNTAIAFFVIIFAAFLASLLVPSVLESMVAYMQAVIENADIITDEGGLSAARIFANNLRAALMSTLYGCIPLIYLPALAIGLNAAVLGALAAYYQLSGLSLLLFLAGIVPHGIVEIPALLLAFACGLYLCKELTARILRRETSGPLSGVFLSIARLYLTVIVPLLVMASVLEAYVTPLVLSFLIS